MTDDVPGRSFDTISHRTGATAPDVRCAGGHFRSQVVPRAAGAAAEEVHGIPTNDRLWQVNGAGTRSKNREKDKKKNNK